MVLFPISALILTAVLGPVQIAEDQQIDAMISKLGDQNYQVRQSATNWLMQHPNAASRLRKVVKSRDPEVLSRATAILAHFDLLPVRRLNIAVDDGRVDEVIEGLSNWPKGKNETEAWTAICELKIKLLALHHKNGGHKFRRDHEPTKTVPSVIVAERFKQIVLDGNHPIFLRAGDVVWRERGFPAFNVIVATGSVAVAENQLAWGWILARGHVQVSVSHECIIVSGSDVIVERALNCLIIAKGKVTLTGGAFNCRIIAGGSVVKKYAPENCIISENDLNPLGYIRWDDSPKVEPKKK